MLTPDMLSFIAPSTRNDAIRFAHQQGELGNTPASVADGSAKLCAAACLAYVALKESGEVATSQEFAGELLSGKVTLPAVFNRLGWSTDVCKSVMENNDRTAAPARLSWFHDLCGRG